MSSRHQDLLQMADKRDQDAADARSQRDNAPRGSWERGVYAQQAEDAAGEARTLRFTVADEKWRAKR